MKKGILLNQSISNMIAGMGHKDTIAIGDCGLPIPDGPVRIDLALKKGVPGFWETLEAVLEELCVERIIIASEMMEFNQELYRMILSLFPDIEIEQVVHEQFKSRTAACKAVIRTGEYIPYANIILQSGVTF